VEGKEHIGCRLKKSIFGLIQTSRQWYLKFDKIVRKFGFKNNLCKAQEWEIHFPHPVCGWYLTR
jgi:hypothetical protein